MAVLDGIDTSLLSVEEPVRYKGMVYWPTEIMGVPTRRWQMLLEKYYTPEELAKIREVKDGNS